MSIYAELARAARVTELEDSNEVLHSEILEKNSTIDGLGLNLQEQENELDRLDRKIQAAIGSLRVLDEVPIRDLTASVGNIIEGLKA